MHSSPLLTARIKFYSPREAAVSVATGPGFDRLTDSHTLLLQLYSKTMYDLGRTDHAVRLRDFMSWAAGQAGPGDGSSPEATAPSVTGGHFSLVSPDEKGTVVATAEASLFMNINGVKVVSTEYQTPHGQAQYYAWLTVPVCFQHLLDSCGARNEILVSAVGVRAMSETYRLGPASWNSLGSIVPVAMSGLEAGSRALADELARITLDGKGVGNVRIPLHDAAQSGDLQKAQELIHAEADVDAREEYGVAPLHDATIWGNSDVARALIGGGAAVDPRTDEGLTPLHFAARDGHVVAAECLLEHGANLEAQDNEGWTPLHWAASRGRTDLMRMLIRGGADVSARTEQRQTPLHLVNHVRGQKHPSETARLLIEHGASLAARDESGDTPLNGLSPGESTEHELHETASQGNTEGVEHLLDLGAHVNAASAGEYTVGWTPLHAAAACGRTRTCHLLIERGADVNVHTADGDTPTRLALADNHLDTAAILRQHGGHD